MQTSLEVSKAEIKRPSERNYRGDKTQTSGVSDLGKPAVLMVDADVVLNNVMRARLGQAGFRCVLATSSRQPLQIVAAGKIDAVVSALAPRGEGGLELLREARKKHPSVAFLLITSLEEAEAGAQAIRAGADDYLVRPVQIKEMLKSIRRALDRKRAERDSVAARERLERLVSERTAQLDSALRSAGESYQNTLLALGAALDLRGAQTAGHSRRVCEYSLEIARRMNFSDVELKTLGQGALLHDIGKLSVPDSILLKPGPLTDEEWITMRAHVEIGHDLLARIPFLHEAAQLILTHHERFDGTGYPIRLKGGEIPRSARIFAVADAFDAMTTPRPYQQMRTLKAASEEICSQANGHFDPQVVEAFVSIPTRRLAAIHMLSR